VSFLEEFADYWIPEPNTGCYLWLRGVNNTGYPRLGTDGKIRVNRVVLTECAGPPPTSKHEAAHNTLNGCCGSICINPIHLRWATHLENMMDMQFTEGERKNRSKRIRNYLSTIPREQLLAKMQTLRNTRGKRD
jgi:hypothetical protein